MKTYKRELAAILLVWFAYVVEVKEVSLVEVLVWPVFTFVALSFGLDWWGKNESKSLSSLPEGKSSLGVREPQEYER
jgi:hypothetical protein